MEKIEINPFTRALEERLEGREVFHTSAQKNERTMMYNGNLVIVPAHIILLAKMAIKKVEEEEEEEETPDVKLPTKKETAAITAAVKKEYKYLLTLPAYNYVTISPAPKLADMNAKELCSYIADKCPRISAVPAFSTCTPTVPVVQGILALFLPLANTGFKNLIPADKVLYKTLNTQLRQNASTLFKSIGTLSNGNAPLFALSGVANKAAGKKHNAQLDACEFTLDTTRGKGSVYVIAKVVPYASNYTVYYGPGTVYDPKTWLPKTGGSKQLIQGLTPGVQYGFVIVANGKVLQGHWADAQTRYAPFN